MISVWSVILIAIPMGLFFGAINILIAIIYDKKKEKAFEEHMKRMGYL